MNEGELRSLLPPEGRLPADRRNELEEELMDAIDRESGSAGSTGEATVTQRKRRWRRRSIGGAVGVAAALGATAAAAAMMQSDSPDPEQAARVNEANEERASVHLPGWRVPLDAEGVWCVYGSPGPAEFFASPTTAASEFPLEEALTEEHLIEECVNGTDYARAMYEGAGEAVTCIREGPIDRPVVLVDSGTCDEADLAPITDDDLAELNRLRSIEVALMAVPTEHECPTFEEARDWVVTQLDDNGEDLSVLGADHGPSCYSPRVYWPLELDWPDDIPEVERQRFEDDAYYGVVIESDTGFPPDVVEDTPPTTYEG